jgi:Peptidase M66
MNKRNFLETLNRGRQLAGLLGLLTCIALLSALTSCGGGASATPSRQVKLPSISSFSPATGPVGTSVILNGANLTGATQVTLNGTAASFSVNSATRITATVPTAASSGKFSVTTAGGTANSGTTFTVTSASAPTISSFTPTSGQAGTSVTISGTNLTGATAIAFNGTAASFTVNGATQITAAVPNGATTGKISVTTPNGTATSTGSFTVPGPTISSFNPSSGQVGTSVTITGTNLTGATAVAFNGTAASYTVNSATQISAAVPSGTTTGKISVTTPNGSAASLNSFTVTTSSGLDLTIDGLYVTQATQDYPNNSVPLVKDRSGWVRVFVKANQANTAAPQVRVQFINGSTTNTLTIPATSASVPTSADPNTDTAWDAAVPAAWIQPGVQVVALVDPSGAIAESDKTNNQFSQTLDVRTLQTWKVTLLPVHTGNGLTGVIENANRTRADWVDFAKRLHPVPDTVNVALGATMNSSVTSLSSNGNGWSTVLSEVSAKRSADGVTDRYYFGVVKVSYTSGVAGIGYIGFPAAIGWDFNSGPSVLAHEEGHNFGRPHSPCGGASNPDPNYPYAGGIIGVPGWDAFATSSNLKTSANHTDIMGYCSNQWVSDYVYTSILNFRANNSFDIAPDVVGAAGQEGLLVWGRIENGRAILEPAFRVPATGVVPQAGPYTWEAHDALGRKLLSIPFDAPEVADLPGNSVRVFSFVVPVTTEHLANLHSLSISKDGRELARVLPAAAPGLQANVHVQRMANRNWQLSWNAQNYPVLMLRDARTHEVRGFLRGGSASVEEVPDDVEIHFSDGVHSHMTSYHAPAQ